MHTRRVLITLVTVTLGGAVGQAYQQRKSVATPAAPVALVASPAPTVSTLSVTAPTPRPESTDTITLLFGGDIMLGRTVQTKIEQKGIDWPLQSLTSTLTSADITAANLEGPALTDAPQTQPDSLVLRAYPPALKGLQNAGIDIVSLANNHIPDMGIAGVKETTGTLDGLGIAHAGAGISEMDAAQPVIVERRGMKVGFLSYTYGVNYDSKGVYYNVATPERVSADVKALIPQADAVVVFCHCGVEYHPLPNQMQQDVAHAAIDAGASLFIGHHPHVPEPFEQYKNGLIVYSLGNLVFDQQPGQNRDHSALAQVTLTGNKPTKLQLLPYHIYDLSQPRFITDPTEKQAVWDLFKLPSGQWP